MFKCVSIVAALVAVSAAQQLFHHPQQQHVQGVVAPKVIPITHYMNIVDDAGQFSLQYQDGAGTSETRRGVLQPTRDGKNLVLVQDGTYSYVSPEGVVIQTSYRADENGFQPTGDHLPAPTQV